jgi:hypothetical protein
MNTQEAGMSFREKTAWISVILLIALFGPYFGRVALALAGKTHVHGGTQFAMISAFVLLEIVLRVAIGMHSPRDARAPRDEREDLIDMRATRAAFYVLLGGVLVAIFTLHFPVSVWMLSQFVLFAVVLSELVRFGGQIRLFRRGF